MSDDDVSRYFDIVPVPFVQAVGRVVTYWAWSEALLEIHLALVWRAPKARQDRNFKSDGQSEDRDSRCASSQTLHEKFVDELEAEGRVLADFRNLVAHGYIAVGVGERLALSSLTWLVAN